MAGKKTLTCLIFQVLAVAAAIASFKLVPDKRMAAIMASTGFVLLGVYQFTVVLRHGTWYLSLLFWSNLVFLGVFSFPMFWYRVLTDAPFTDFKYLGIAGPILHQWSERLYPIMTIGALLDWLRFYFALKFQGPPSKKLS